MLPCRCERQIEVRTPYDIRLTTSALAALLASPHPALDAIQVCGRAHVPEQRPAATIPPRRAGQRRRFALTHRAAPVCST